MYKKPVEGTSRARRKENGAFLPSLLDSIAYRLIQVSVYVYLYMILDLYYFKMYHRYMNPSYLLYVSRGTI